MFIDGFRAKGMEVPACIHCNGRFAPFDSFFSLLVLTMGSAFHIGYEDRINGLIGSAAQRFPSAIQEIVRSGRKTWINHNGLMKPVTAITFENEEIPFVMNFVSCRMAAAIFYLHTRQILPVGSTLYSRWQTKVQPFGKDELKQLFAMMPDYATIRQGKIDQSDQFECRYAIDPDSSTAAIALNFHKVVQSVVFIGDAAGDAENTERWMKFEVTDQGLTPSGRGFPKDLRIKHRDHR